MSFEQLAHKQEKRERAAIEKAAKAFMAALKTAQCSIEEIVDAINEARAAEIVREGKGDHTLLEAQAYCTRTLKCNIPHDSPER